MDVRSASQSPALHLCQLASFCLGSSGSGIATQIQLPKNSGTLVSGSFSDVYGYLLLVKSKSSPITSAHCNRRHVHPCRAGSRRLSEFVAGRARTAISWHTYGRVVLLQWH